MQPWQWWAVKAGGCERGCCQPDTAVPPPALGAKPNSASFRETQEIVPDLCPDFFSLPKLLAQIDKNPQAGSAWFQPIPSHCI